MQMCTFAPPQPLPPALSHSIPGEEAEWSAHQSKYQYLQEMILDLLPQNLDVAKYLQWSDSICFFRSWILICDCYVYFSWLIP